jgi:hypothetical protein
LFHVLLDAVFDFSKLDSLPPDFNLVILPAHKHQASIAVIPNEITRFVEPSLSPCLTTTWHAA